MHACVSTPLCLEKLEPEVAALTSRPLGRGRKWGFFPKPLGPYWRGSDPWKGWFRRGERLVAGSQFGVLGTKAASLKSKKVCVCVCVCVAAKAPGGVEAMVIHGEGCWAILLSKPLLISGLEDQQKKGTT